MAKLIDKIVSMTKPKVKTKSGIKIPIDELYDYSTLERREATIEFLYNNSKGRRQTYDTYCRLMKRYYDGEHDTSKQMAAFVQSQGLPWSPTQCTDGFIHVETQIDTNIPEFEFSGRDDDLDSAKAKQRENVCRYVVDNNPMAVMNTRNERRMNMYGLAAWKVAFNLNKKMGRYDGDIVIGNPKVQQLFWDPNITDDIDEGEYFPVVYRMHKMAVARTFATDLKRIGKTIQDFDAGYGYSDTEFLKEENEVDSSNFDYADETLQITEWYFKQSTGGKTKIDGLDFIWDAGDIGLVILINQEEIRYVPKYWRKTGCQMYPLSVYCKVPNDDTITGKSEIELIKDYIDAADRALSYAQLNDAFMANDITVEEKGALAEDSTLQNVPGGRVVLNPGKMNAFARLPGLSGTNRPLYDSANLFIQKMQNTNGNFDISQGNPSTKPKTAFEIALLNDNSNSRQGMKKPDREAGWARLIKLIDYTALENFDDDRIIFIGAKDKKLPTVFSYNSGNMKISDYYPTVDIKMHMGNGIKNSKAFSIQALKEMLQYKVSPENGEFFKAYIIEIDVPQKVELCDFIDKVVSGQIQNMAQEMAKQMMMEQQKQQEEMAKQQTQQPPSGGNAISMQDILSQLTPEELAAIEKDPSIMHNAATQNGIKL